MRFAAMRTTLALGALALSQAAAFAQAPCQAAAPAPIQLPAGPLDKALPALAAQTGCPVQYDKKQVQQLRSPAVAGKLTAAEALIRLVQGTGLEAHSGPKGLSINQADQQAIGLRAATLQARLGQALKSRKIAPATADAIYGELSEVRNSVAALAKKQGFVSAGEKASYQRTFAKAEQVLTKSKQG